jgi:signal transduction histidine kinase
VVEPLPSGSLGLVRDITDRVALERRRREMQRLVSHELKTPLASISGFGEMLATYQLSPEELRRVAGLIRGESDRLGEMVRSFLDLERMSAGAWDDEIERLDLSRLVAQRCELHARAADAAGQRLELRAQPDVAVRGVERLLAQLVDNLVGNALKYSPSGSEIVVEVAARPPGGAEMSVADTGPGIPAEAVPRLFERFYRVPGTPREGSGLGLAVVKEVADWHRANVSVDTAPDRGTTIMVAFEPEGEENRNS